MKLKYLVFRKVSGELVGASDRPAETDRVGEHGPCEEVWPGGYCAYITDPSGHSVEISYNQEAGYNALFDPVCDPEALKNTYKDGEELWVDCVGARLAIKRSLLRPEVTYGPPVSVNTSAGAP
jgi:hypothetical protein